MIFSNLQFNLDREFWLFDTFEGLPSPTEEDGETVQAVWRNAVAGRDKKRERRRRVEERKWNYGPIDVVRNNMLFTQYPPRRIHLVRGKVEDTLARPHGRLPE